MTAADLSDSVVHRVARVFGLTVKSLHRATGGFSGADVWQVQTEQAAFAMRRLPRTSCDVRRLNAVCSLQTALRQRGLACVPEPRMPIVSVSTMPSEQGVCVGYALMDATSVWQVEEWMSGREVQGVPQPEQAVEFLKTLRLMHQTMKECGAKTPVDPWVMVSVGPSTAIQNRAALVRDLQQGLLESLQSRSVLDCDPNFRTAAESHCRLLQQSLLRFSRELIALENCSWVKQPVLRDLWRPHVLFQETRVSGVIDWSALHTDHVTCDLSRLLRSWYGVCHSQHAEMMQCACDLWELSADERRLFQVLDHATVLLSPVTWIRRRCESESQSPMARSQCERLQDLVSVAASYVEWNSFA